MSLVLKRKAQELSALYKKTSLVDTLLQNLLGSEKSIYEAV